MKSKRVNSIEGVQVGDKVWDLNKGWGEVIEIAKDDFKYPITVYFGKTDTNCFSYTIEGYLINSDDNTSSLFVNPENQQPHQNKVSNKEMKMNKFNLKKFKAGYPAITPNGLVAKYLTTYPGNKGEHRIIFYIEDLKKPFECSIDGICSDANYNLVGTIPKYGDWEIDCPVIATSGLGKEQKGHFAGVSIDGNPVIWADGRTSFTATFKKELVNYDIRKA